MTIDLPPPAHVVQAQSVNFDRLLVSLEQIESGCDDYAIGPHGERSAWQLKYATWRMYSDLSFRDAARCHWAAFLVAQAHVRRIAATIPRPSVYRIALAFHIGITALMDNRVSVDDAHYAERVARVYALKS